MNRRPCGQTGYTLIEVLVATALSGMMTIVGIGSLQRLLGQSATRAMNTTFQGLVAQSQNQAIMGRSNTGILFTSTVRGVTAQVFKDGDGDGVMHEDIASGVDHPLGSAILLSQDGWATIGMPDGVLKDPLGNKLTSQDPVKFGTSDILSFSETCTATPGSLYLRDASGKEGWAFRVAGIDGRIRLYHWWHGHWTEAK